MTFCKDLDFGIVYHEKNNFHNLTKSFLLTKPTRRQNSLKLASLDIIKNKGNLFCK
jgi:hypothetical protein